MTPRSEQQYEDIRSEKKELIKAVALDLFAKEGYHATSISKIASKADISKGLLYNYYSSKEDLLKELVIESAHKVWQHFDPDNDGVLTKEEFVYFIEKDLQTVRENITHWKFYSAIIMQPGVMELLEGEFEGMGNQITILLLNFFKTCGCDDPEDEMMFFSSLMKGGIMQYISSPLHFPLDRFEKKVLKYYKEKLNIK